MVASASPGWNRALVIKCLSHCGHVSPGPRDAGVARQCAHVKRMNAVFLLLPNDRRRRRIASGDVHPRPVGTLLKSSRKKLATHISCGFATNTTSACPNYRDGNTVVNWMHGTRTLSW